MHPVVTPRFVPTCTPQLLQALGRLAAREGCRVQSHISESLDNQAFVAALRPEVGRRGPSTLAHAPCMSVVACWGPFVVVALGFQR